MKTSIKSLIDVLFILLLGTIVLLAHSVHIGAVDAEPLRLGGGAVAPVRAADVELVVVDETGLDHDGRRFALPDELAGSLRPDATVLLIVADEQVSHHQVMAVWSALSARGLDVGLGAEPLVEPSSTPARTPDRATPAGLAQSTR
ncbi:MAG: hypothetical protein ACYTJ0_06590 [Planctomycetota bacterium]